MEENENINQDEQKQNEEIEKFMNRLDNFENPKDRLGALNEFVSAAIKNSKIEDACSNYFDGSPAEERFIKSPELMGKLAEEIKRVPPGQRNSARELHKCFDNVISSLSIEELSKLTKTKENEEQGGWTK